MIISDIHVQPPSAPNSAPPNPADPNSQPQPTASQPTSTPPQAHDKPAEKFAATLRSGSVGNPVIKPVIIACVLTAVLMVLTVAVYISGTPAAKKDTMPTAGQPVQEAPPTPLTASDIESAADFATSQSEALNRVDIPAESGITDDSLGL